jgi:hypothetical protein
MSQWAVWTDPSDGLIYASWVSNPTRAFSTHRIFELRADGAIREINAEGIMPPPPSACAIEALATLTDKPKLVQPAVISLEGKIYARNGSEIWTYDEVSHEWLPAIPTPPELVKVKGGGLMIRDE